MAAIAAVTVCVAAPNAQASLIADSGQLAIAARDGQTSLQPASLTVAPFAAERALAGPSDGLALQGLAVLGLGLLAAGFFRRRTAQTVSSRL